MKIIEIFKNKYIIMFLVLIITNVGFYIYGNYNGFSTSKNTAQVLNEKEKQLESLNTELGISKSQLTSQSDLNKKLASENDELKSKFNDFVKNNNLKIISVDDSIVSVKQQTKGSKQVVVVSSNCSVNTEKNNPVISYEWHDEFNRFYLKDPNIFNPNDTIFTASQNFKIVGEVFKQKNGKLETRRMVLQEVRELKDNTGRTKYIPIDGIQAKLVDSEFNYIEDGEIKIFRPRAIALFDTNRYIGLGVELFNFHNIGLNTHLSIPVSFSQFKNGTMRFGGAYNFVFDEIKTNIGLGASIGTEFDRLFHSYNFSLDILFYLND